jgi:hypothetical protein
VLPVLLRAAPWHGLLALSAAGAGLGSAGGAVLTSSSLMQLHLGLVLVGGAASFAMDDPAAAVVDACPVRRSRRVAARALAATVPLGIGAALVLSWWARTTSDAGQLLQLLGCWVLGFALAAVARLRLEEPGEVVAAGLMLVLLTVLLVQPIGRRAALFNSDDRAAWSWTVVLAGSGLALVVAVRERRWATKVP